MKKKKEIENRQKKTVMSFNFSSFSAYLVLCIFSWVFLCPRCIQMLGLLVYSKMKKQPKFCVRKSYIEQSPLQWTPWIASPKCLSLFLTLNTELVLSWTLNSSQDQKLHCLVFRHWNIPLGLGISTKISSLGLCCFMVS